MTASIAEQLPRGDVRAARAHLEAHPDDCDACDERGVSLVLLCLYHGKAELARWVAAHRRRPLDACEAAALGDGGRLSALLTDDREAACARSGDGFGALGLACYFAQPACARLLIDAGAPVDEPAANATRVTPLHSAAAARQLEIARWLLAGGAAVDARQHGGFTALHAAAQNGDRPLVELLLAHGADRAARTDERRSAADLARAAGHEELLAWLA